MFAKKKSYRKKNCLQKNIVTEKKFHRKKNCAEKKFCQKKFVCRSSPKKKIGPAHLNLFFG